MEGLIIFLFLWVAPIVALAAIASSRNRSGLIIVLTRPPLPKARTTPGVF